MVKLGGPLLANHGWQSTLISLVAFVAVASLKNGPARASYFVGLPASAKFVLPSALLLPLAHSLGIDFSSLVEVTGDVIS